MRATTTLLIFVIGCLVAKAAGRTEWKSPSGNYAIVRTGELSMADQKLEVRRQGKALTHYDFEGTLNSIYWSPKESYVAFDNHYGHRAQAVWIISLKDGSLVRIDGKPTPMMKFPDDTKAVAYDRYLDSGYLPDAAKFAAKQLEGSYPGYSKDRDKRGSGRLTVVYGWQDDATLKLFDEIELDGLYETEGNCLQIESLLSVKPVGLAAHVVSVEKVAQNSGTNRPPEVLRVIGSD